MRSVLGVRIASGVSRIVIVVGRLAFKLPRPFPLRRFRKGRISNQLERAIYKQARARGWDELCPVIWSASSGMCLIMPAVDPLTHDEFFRFFDGNEYPDRYPDPGMYEHKPDDWGLLKGRPVVIDYAAWVHQEAAGWPNPIKDFVPGCRVPRDPGADTLMDQIIPKGTDDSEEADASERPSGR